MECPTCKYRVPAEWSLCRRCGAPLHPEPEDNRITVPPSMQRHHAAPVGPAGPGSRRGPNPAPTSSALAAIAAAARNGPPPAPPNPVPRVHAGPPPGPSPRRLATLAGRGARRILVLAIVAVALTLSIVAVWPVLFRSNPPSNSAATASAARAAVATDLLKTVVGGGRSLFAVHHTFANISLSALSADSYRVPIVASTKVAPGGAVSVRVNSPTEITLASPADPARCVFARDEPKTARTLFVTIRTADCRAAAAPVQGWVAR